MIRRCNSELAQFIMSQIPELCYILGNSLKEGDRQRLLQICHFVISGRSDKLPLDRLFSWAIALKQNDRGVMCLSCLSRGVARELGTVLEGMCANGPQADEGQHNASVCSY